MKYSNNDVLNIRGVVPFLPEDRCAINDDVDSTTKLIYTAGNNTTLIITNISYSFDITIAGNIDMYVTDSSDSILYHIVFIGSANPIAGHNTINTYFPYEVNPTEKIYLYAGEASVLTVSILGVERWTI